MPLSLLDRLLKGECEDPDPSSNSIAYRRQLEASICRDLTGLLNARRAEREIDESFGESNKSMLTYGIVDFTSFNLTSDLDQERLRVSIERAIRQFEPRLPLLNVTLEQAEPGRLTLHLGIEAVLKNNLRKEPVMFDVTLQRDSRRIQVSGGQQ